MAKDGTLRLLLHDVYGNRIGERVDLSLRHQTLSDHRVVKGVDASKAIAVTKLHCVPQGTYRLEVDPPSYLPTARFVTVRASGITEISLTFAIDPKKVKSVRFPQYSALPTSLRTTLAASAAVLTFEERSGAELYDQIDDIRRAGLLNIAAKAGATRFENGRPVLDYVQELRELRGDRIFATVSRELREETKNSVAAGLFRTVNGSLHRPPPGFTEAGSFKTDDHYGNLQLTFFFRDRECVADIDIDDAGGLAHVFQVLRNELTDRPTHPYDIHEILVLHQQLTPSYEFVV